MGLGKTCQLCVHFGSLARFVNSPERSTRSAGLPVFLVVCPPTVLHHWLREMRQWEATMRTIIIHGMTRESNLMSDSSTRKTILRTRQ